MDFLLKVFLFYPSLLFSLCVHEFAHAWTARRLGDLTASQRGRLTLNPLAHIDFVGTLFLPLTAVLMNFPVFGWAKPVPVDPACLKNPKKDMFWVAFSGPLSNFLLSFLGCIALMGIYILERSNLLKEIPLGNMVEVFIYINLLLGCFNLIPLHPLDGGKVMARFLPASWNMFLERNQHYSSVVLVLLFVSGGFYFLAVPVSGAFQGLTGLARVVSGWVG